VSNAFKNKELTQDMIEIVSICSLTMDLTQIFIHSCVKTLQNQSIDTNTDEIVSNSSFLKKLTHNNSAAQKMI
jgi:hypothetical protein